MKISLIKPDSINVNPWVDEFRRQGVEVLVNDASEDCDFIICNSVSQMGNLSRVHKQYPDIPMINYNWDFYPWLWKHARGYDWHGYGRMLKESVEVWVSSTAVWKRTDENFGVGDKSKVILTFVRDLDYPLEKIRDDRFVFQPMRRYEHDKTDGWLKRACEELNIPLLESNHKLSEADFKEKIATCSFMVMPYYECSTGGLSVIEAVKFGKVTLMNDSEYQGGSDYLGDKARYFQAESYEDMKAKIKEMWEDTPTIDLDEASEFMEKYTVEKMVAAMKERLDALAGAK